MSYEYIKSDGPPPNAVAYGWQNDGGGQQWSAIAHTDFGTVAGKAKDNKCWYPYGDEEHETTDFSWLTASEGKIAPVTNTGSPPSGAVSVGPQNNEDGDYYAAVAICENGLIPGKARGSGCWYSYGGKEIYTEDFLWLVSM